MHHISSTEDYFQMRQEQNILKDFFYFLIILNSLLMTVYTVLL